MKNTLTAILITCGFFTTFSQELKKITDKDKKSSIIEEYFVLKEDKDVKHGLYKKMRESEELIESGFYKNNLKDSLWVFFARNGSDTLTFGYYTEDNKVGPWTYNDRNGTLRYVYNYTTKRVSEYNWKGEPKEFLILTKNGWVEKDIDSPPIVLEGEEPLETIARNIRYPTRAWRGGIDGEVIVSFIVDSTGRMDKVRIKEKVDPDLDKEALRVFEAIEFDWLPAQKDDKLITIEYFLPVKFTLRK